MYAGMFGFISASAALARCGAALDVVNDKGQTALHICAVYGQTRMAMFLLRLGEGCGWLRYFEVILLSI
jgi:ankyrin repeat protein